MLGKAQHGLENGTKDVTDLKLESLCLKFQNWWN